MTEKESLEKVAVQIEKELGLFFPENRHVDLKRGLVNSSKALYDDTNPQRITEEIITNTTIPKKILDTLSATLTISETYFFRERPAISFIKEVLIPKLYEKKGIIKIWSAGCSSGEEPYTIAILLKEHLPEEISSRVSIIATDVNSKSIHKALEGLYSEWSFRETPDIIKGRYFTKTKGGWRLNEDIRKMVKFSFLNLVKDPFPDPINGTDNLDIILCRNVLMYFSYATIKRVADKFNNSLLENGWLIVSQVELNDLYLSNFEKYSYENGIFYKKNSDKHSPKIFKPKNTLREKRDTPSYDKKELPHKKIVKEEQSFTTLEKMYLNGEYEACIEDCQKCSEKKPTDHSYLHLMAKCYANSGDYNRAIECIDKVIESGVSSEDIYYLYGTVLKENNEPAKAEIALKKGIYLNPGHLFSHLMLGNIMNQEGKTEASVRYYNNVLDILSNMDDKAIISDSGGLTKARMTEMVEALIKEKRR
jgi:chemotaxis protein methyltransferase CheR